jgi:hypothetical protein
MLRRDIVRLAELGVNELQIESLKLLPGTKMRSCAEAKGLKYSPLPPYEILQTPQMTPQDLGKAMKISRMIDLYYNSDAWQDIIRELICSTENFLQKFTYHLDDMMILNSPVSLERRGLLLFNYCKEHHPESLSKVSLAWIEAGFSLKKEPAGNILKVKHMEAYLSENNLQIKTEYGQLDSTLRYYLYTSEEQKVIFGYDSQAHLPAPIFRATVTTNQHIR